MVSKRKDAFINAINLTLVREEDNLTHDFQWLFFHTSEYNYLDPKSAVVKTPYSFQIQKNSPYNYCITFRDQSTTLRVFDGIMKIARKWDEIVKSGAIANDKLSEIRNVASLNPNNYPAKEIFDLIQPLRESQENNDVYMKILDLNYWKAGNYIIKFKVQISGEKRPILKELRFLISDDDEAQLKLNVVNVCTFPIIQNLGFRPLPFNYRNQGYK